MELIKIVRAIGSFVLALFIVAMPFMCALSYALKWGAPMELMYTVMTIWILIAGTLLIYAESGD